MKTIATLILILTFSLKAYSAPWQKLLVRPADGKTLIDVPAGRIIEFLSVETKGIGNVNVSFDFGSGVRTNGVDVDDSYVGPVTMETEVFGPDTGDESNWIMVFYRIRDNGEAPTSIPATSVVIPSNTEGSVKITLETSIDLENWIDATPGLYGGDTTRRYFRVVAEKTN